MKDSKHILKMLFYHRFGLKQSTTTFIAHRKKKGKIRIHDSKDAAESTTSKTRVQSGFFLGYLLMNRQTTAAWVYSLSAIRDILN